MTRVKLNINNNFSQSSQVKGLDVFTIVYHLLKLNASGLVGK